MSRKKEKIIIDSDYLVKIQVGSFVDLNIVSGDELEAIKDLNYKRYKSTCCSQGKCRMCELGTVDVKLLSYYRLSEEEENSPLFDYILLKPLLSTRTLIKLAESS